MRVISGKYRGLNLAEFRGSDIRPTADRVKESLFNILSYKIMGATVLDLFCGSGSLGIECLSRGAKFVHFNDISPASIAVLNKNLYRLRGEKYAVTTGDWLPCVRGLKQKFDLAFIDPPYADDCGIRAIEELASRKLVYSGGMIVYERDRAFTGTIAGLDVTDERKYGKTYLTFFQPNTVN
ncbi:MAG TPA: 16S rRNA (guanine(966)-N(2))-methyltransferase RsmD [Candidatus Coproplasma stercorigallinarum]|nr:16S rRNA (guanine(966)-N(2))-methyltransferase RsmD [Candidatus Coproplasma stercorigallinarum]